MSEQFDIRELQETLLDAVKEFKKICDEENITFFLRGGSVMGAVKYGGFIPWDDDMDIAVPRKDYARLIEIFNNREIAGKYKVLNSKYQPELHCYFPRLFLLESEREKLGLPSNTHLGLHLIDILPLDGAPNNKVSRNIYFCKVYILRFLASLGTTYTEGHVDMHTAKQKLLINTAKCLQLHKLFPQQKVYAMLDKLYTRYDWEKQQYAGTITASLFKKEVMPTEIWGEGILHQFETEEYLIPAQYDQYLKRMYGENYLTEEPANKKSHHE
ncbi:LicD family protein [Streptococcus suis]|uniref:LicD family protein n=1 Tax=Streptococcus suis TaxID=1307 RepID=UPI001EFF56B2|nr:LicD family protein [Streptococcus suis]MCG9872570.1 LicD family protein [Streptococcus suis]MCG9918996.1 LicD family protein [Streptococcus suis]MCG9921246.1 LicD family protein [Streptococcus suis]MCG9925441.1 LicD family protein [Streptococcus suis]MCG9927449.1 LicD family protein [Streptococcus suis]